MKKKYLITVLGPTAIGKTTLSIKLARAFDSEIISADSRQFYKEMNIGTAVPSPRELAEAPHHFIQNRSIHEDYSVGDFERDALALLDQLFLQHDILLLVGGSGLYVDAVLKGLDTFPDIAPEIRKNLRDELQQNGIKALQDRLKTLDPESFNRIDIENPQRLLRALEVCIGTGKPYTSFLQKEKKSRNFIPVKIGLTAPREVIYNRIEQRVDLMMSHGLLEEARNLYPFRTKNALQTVGYRELFNYFDGKWELDFAVSEIKKNTRRFAKRQLTWYRKDPEIKWFDYRTDSEIISRYIKNVINE